MACASPFYFFFSSRRRHTRCSRDWSSDVCSSDLGVDVECVERLTGSHEQAVFLGAPETKICAGFRDMNSADELAIGREHVHSVKTLASPPGSGPNVAVHITTNTVR